MFAAVAPLIRLPKGMGVFDYAVPHDISLVPGVLVRIPFRRKVIFGLVIEVKKSTRHKGVLKKIDIVINTVPLIDTVHIKSAQFVASHYGMNLGAALQMFLPPLQSRETGKIEIRKIRFKKNNKAIERIVRYRHVSELINQISLDIQNAEDQTLILVPLSKQIESYKGLRKDTLIFDSTMSNKRKREVWSEVRNNAKLIIGTRSATFLPFVNLSQIFIIDEEHDGHKNWDGAPLYRVHDIAKYLSTIYGCSISYCSRFPSVNIVGRIGKNIDDISKIKEKYTNTEIIDMAKERTHQNYEPVSLLVQEHIQKASKNGDIFVYINRKGSSSAIGCRDCGYVYLCVSCSLPYSLLQDKLHCRYCKVHDSAPQKCPKCNGLSMKLRGVGIDTAANWIRRFFDGSVLSPEIITFQSGDNPEILKKAKNHKVILGTAASLPHLEFSRISMILVIDADQMLRIPEHTGAEQTLATLIYLQAQLEEKAFDAKLYIQTHSILHPVIKAIESYRFSDFYKSELLIRKQLVYPPYCTLMKLSCIDENAINNLNKLKQKILIQDNTVNVSLYSLVPKRYGKKDRMALLVKLSKNDWYNQAKNITSIASFDIRIDINPISLLS